MGETRRPRVDTADEVVERGSEEAAGCARADARRSSGITQRARIDECADQARLPERGARKGERPPPEFQNEPLPGEAEDAAMPERLGIGRRPGASHAGTGRARTRDGRGGHASRGKQDGEAAEPDEQPGEE